MESSASGDAFAVLFLVALFGILFGVPIWLMVRHHKKSKSKIADERREYESLSPEQKAANKKQGYENLAGVVGLVAGVLIGSRLLGNVIIGFLLGAVLGIVFRLIAAQINKR